MITNTPQSAGRGRSPSKDDTDRQEPTASDHAPVTASRSRRSYADLGSRYALVVILALMVIGFSLALPNTFPTSGNLSALLTQQVTVLLLSVGVVLPLILGELDLSIGYVLGIGQVFVIGLMTMSNFSIPFAILASLIACALVGMISGLIVVKGKVNAIITTLGVGSILSGIAYAYTGGRILYENVPPEFVALARSKFLGLPLPVYYAAVLVVLLELFLTFTVAGRRLYVIGGNRRAAVLNGLQVDRAIVLAFVGSAAFAGLAGVLLSAQLASAQADTGPSFLLPAFAAVFLGATTIRPGKFNVLGTAVAVFALAVPVSGLQQLGAPSWFQSVFNGAALLIAVLAAEQLGLLRLRQARQAKLKAYRAAIPKENSK